MLQKRIKCNKMKGKIDGEKLNKTVLWVLGLFAKLRGKDSNYF